MVVIPMAGTGDRYRRAGHVLPKPLIDVDGEPMIARVVAMFPGASFLFIVNRDHVRDFAIDRVLRRLAPSCRLVEVAPHKDGPVATLLGAAEALDTDEDALVTYCDYGVEWDFGAFRGFVGSGRFDAAITSYRGFHPHLVGPQLYAHTRVDGDRVTAIREKGFWSDRRAEPASAGLYWFKSGRRLLESCRRLVASGERVNGEFYASLLIDEVLRAGGPVGWFELARFFQWGTAEDLADYVAWARAMRRLDGHLASCSERSDRTAQVVAMAGLGKRFSDEGFVEAKPYIEVAGRTLVEWSTATLPATSTRVLVTRAELEARAKTLQIPLKTSGRLQVLPALTDGQARTAVAGLDGLDPDAPVLIAPCDAACVFDVEAWRAREAASDADCIVWTGDHLPARWNPASYGWVVADAEGRVTACDVKRAVDDVAIEGQETIVGTFHFRRARDLVSRVEEMARDGDRVNGELYLDTVVRRLVRAGRGVRRFKVDKWMPLGTPDEVRTFAYWSDVFRRGT